VSAGLALRDFFDLLHEHVPCTCPHTYKRNGVESDVCPRHRAQKGYGMALANGDTVPIPQALFPMETIGEFLTGWDSDIPRVVIAVVLWRVTAEYADDREPLRIPTGQTITDTAEQYVRDHWEQAEANECGFAEYVGGRARTISQFVYGFCLLDDYQRVKLSKQHMAFYCDRDEETTR
jgi:hypothetical protein